MEMGKSWPFEPPNPAQPHLTDHLRGPLLVGDTACPAKLAPGMAAVRGQWSGCFPERGLSCLPHHHPVSPPESARAAG